MNVLKPIEDAQFMAQVNAIVWNHVATLLSDPRFLREAVSRETRPERVLAPPVTDEPRNREERFRFLLHHGNGMWSRDATRFYRSEGRLNIEGKPTETYIFVNKDDLAERRPVTFKTILSRWKYYLVQHQKALP